MMNFEELTKINVSHRVEKKNGLSYLSWAWAWDEFKKACPDATYEIKKFANNLPYTFDENTGYMVFTSVTVNDETHEMWLPVMDFKNNAMKNVVYQKFGKDVQPATMFDINKTIMRCLVKNMAMFGLGLYIYAGEDLPEGKDEESFISKMAGFAKFNNKEYWAVMNKHEFKSAHDVKDLPKQIKIVKEIEQEINKNHKVNK